MWIGEEVLVDNLRKKEQKCKIEVGKKRAQNKKVQENCINININYVCNCIVHNLRGKKNKNVKQNLEKSPKKRSIEKLHSYQ